MNSFPGAALLKSVTVSIGGHQEKRWYCKSCGASASDPVVGRKCSAPRTTRTTDYDKFREDYGWGTDKSDEDIDSWLWNSGPETEKEYEKVVDLGPCPGESFVFETREGTVVDRMDSNMLNLWTQLSLPR